MLQSQQTDLFAETGSKIYPCRSHSLFTGKPRTYIQLEVPGSSQFTTNPNLGWLIYQRSWTFGRTNGKCILIVGRSQNIGVYQLLPSSPHPEQRILDVGEPHVGTAPAVPSSICASHPRPSVQTPSIVRWSGLNHCHQTSLPLAFSH